jgi:hypothetical protein
VRLQAAAGHRVSLHPPVGFCSASVAISRLPVFAVLARWSSSRSRRHRAESLIFRRRAAICPAAGCLRAPFPCLTQRPGQSFTRRINPVRPVVDQVWSMWRAANQPTCPTMARRAVVRRRHDQRADRLGSLISSLIHPSTPASIGVYRSPLSRQRDLPGRSRAVFLNPEKRKVGGSTPPLTTTSDQAIPLAEDPALPELIMQARSRHPLEGDISLLANAQPSGQARAGTAAGAGPGHRARSALSLSG